MYTDIYKNVPDMTKLVEVLKVENVLSATRDFVEINARYMDELLENQVDLANFYVDSGQKALEVVNDVKDYQDLVSKQKEFMEEYASKITEVAEKNIKLVQDTGKEIQELLNKNIADVKPVKKAARTATRKKAA